jgi:hypothetical protein
MPRAELKSDESHDTEPNDLAGPISRTRNPLDSFR